MDTIKSTSFQRLSTNIGIDIGGSLVKIVLVDDVAEVGHDEGSENTTKEGNGDQHPFEAYIRAQVPQTQEVELPAGWQARVIECSNTANMGSAQQKGAAALRVLVFPTGDLEQVIDKIVLSHREVTQKTRIRIAATGGGAHKFQSKLADKLHVEMAMVNELKAVSGGWRFDVLQSGARNGKVEYPALICNVGTGVSLISIDEQGEFERVSGSGLGGATFWGLVKRLTKYTNFDNAVMAAHTSGDAGRADTLVGDIYGIEMSKEIGMPPDLVAGFLGKLDSPNLSDADIVAALLRMITNNLGQLAVFQARLTGAQSVWFTGGFFQSGSADGQGAMGDASGIIQDAVARAVMFWSAGKVQSLFPQNTSILGALGAVIVLDKE
ncbi:hypothetical protein LPJ66_006780 [Kickxella alabastrina]|uniref:Uncharacterized protein n=1 Tax=Kickxella alabastrina TaxID=61397 RepID=A0ACC1IC56_9FUNG|nr:hypothetical protein LPJ66_006780 [Kickxella alabastrina]